MRKGYKETAVGWIPEEWEIENLGLILTEGKLGGNYSNSSNNDGLPLIKMGNIGRGRINIEKIDFIPNDLDYDHDHLLNEGDLLLNTRNTLELVGKVAIWKNELTKALYNSNLLRMSFDKARVSSNYFMNFFFNSNIGIKQLRQIATGTTSVGAIYTKDLLEIQIPLPPLREQSKIASILSTVDDKIDSINKRIEETRKLKQGLMQRLLTQGIGHTKFKDSPLGRIPEGWEVEVLGDLGKTFNGLSGKTKEHFGKGRPFIPYKNIFKNSSIDPSYLDYVTICEDENQTQVQYGDIFFTTSSETAAEVGFSSVLLTELPNTYLNSFCFGFRLHDFNILLPEYARYLMRGDLTRKAITELAQGYTRYNLSKITLLERLQLGIPPLAEQSKIASVLSAIDDKYDHMFEKKTEYYKLKKGLMQQLLTGKMRVIANRSSKYI